MIPSVAGLLVCVGILMLGMAMRAPMMVSLLASLAFGSTAFATLPALGGSSPLIWVLFVGVLALVSLARRKTFPNLLRLFADQSTAWIVLALTAYAVGSAILLPRLFAGKTTAFVAARVDGVGAIVEVPLEPTNANITQTAYFVLGAISFYLVLILLQEPKRIRTASKAFFVFGWLVGGMGLLDFVGKQLGLGDVMSPIRTASYAMLTENVEAGLARLAGGYPESSSFAQAALAALAFSYTYWRATGSRGAMALSLLLLAMLLLSTSSTAYLGLMLLGIPVAISIGATAFRGKLVRTDIVLLAAAVVCSTLLGAAYLKNPHMFDAAAQLLDSSLFNKAQSLSGKERAYWNTRSLQGFLDTSGLGIGMGSSRSSSWAVSVISQLGIIGSALIVVLILEYARGAGAAKRPHDKPIEALGRATRASALASLASLSVSGASADPGEYFFVCTAVMLACRAYLGQPAPVIDLAPWLVRGEQRGPTGRPLENPT